MFETTLLSGLTFREDFARKCLPFIKDEYFQNPSEREVFKFIHTYITKYNCCPTKEALAIMISDSNIPEGIYEPMLGIISDLEYNEQTSVDWMLEHTEKWAQEKAIYNAIMKAIGIIDGSDTKLDKNAIPDLLMQALAVSFDSHIGHSYFDSVEEHWDYLHSSETKFPFSVGILNKVTKGGVPNKTLNVVMAGINCFHGDEIIEVWIDE